MRTTLFVALLAAVPFLSLKAQPAPSACNGDLAVVRVSEIKPGGTMKGFLDAVDAHKAWYRANGVNDNVIVAAPVLIRDAATRANKFSETQVLTFHIHPPAAARTPNRGDAAWNAYVKLYQDNSDIKQEYMTCLPKLVP